MLRNLPLLFVVSEMKIVETAEAWAELATLAINHRSKALTLAGSIEYHRDGLIWGKILLFAGLPSRVLRSAMSLMSASTVAWTRS